MSIDQAGGYLSADKRLANVSHFRVVKSSVLGAFVLISRQGWEVGGSHWSQGAPHWGVRTKNPA